MDLNLKNGKSRIRYNMKLKDHYKSLDIVAEIKNCTLEWLGYVIRMVNERLPKLI